MLTGNGTCDITEKTSKVTVENSIIRATANVAIPEKTAKVIVQNPIISAAGSVTSLSDHWSPNTSQEPPPKLPSVWEKQPSLSLPIQTKSKSPFKITVIKQGNVEGAKQQLFGPSCRRLCQCRCRSVAGKWFIQGNF
ncbi:Uncharacterized protein APZ42_032354 [Daphnia magna]|uniref:Uncharacterized protein n=1 Tax=Daphnia magna TaxID=35525 RepID=A0A164M2C3_9CRUS|nr:Uncharacterized protein APZ42_032354 [Daphnia magna]